MTGEESGGSVTMQTAHAAFRESDVDRAADICTRVIQADRSDADAWNLLAWCEYQKGNQARAVQGAAEATRHNELAWRYFHDLGYFLRISGDDENAAAAYAKSVELEPNAVPSWSQLGAALTALGRTADAIAAHRRAAEIDYSSATQSLLALVEMDGFGNRPDEMQKLEKAHSMIRVGRDRAQLGFALGKVWDRKKSYAQAFECFDQANRDRRREGHLNVESMVNSAPAYLDQFSEQMMSKAPHSGVESRQPVFIVGMPCSGAEVLESRLAQHSAVAASGQSGELPKLLSGVAQQLPPGVRLLSGLGESALKATARSYLDYLEKRYPGAERVTEVLPLGHTLPGLISKVFPKATVIHVRRDPLDTAWSCWTTSFGRTTMAWTLEELGQFQGVYEHSCQHWSDVCPDSIETVEYESLVRAPDETLKDVLKAIGLGWEAALNDSAKHSPLSRSTIGHARPYRERLRSLNDARERTFASFRGSNS